MSRNARHKEVQSIGEGVVSMGKAADGLVSPKSFLTLVEESFGEANWESEFHFEASIYQLKFA